MSSIKIILYKQKTLKNQEHPVMLYLYEDKPYRLSLGYSCTLKQWDEPKGRFRKNVENHQVKNLNLRKFELKASEIIDDFVREGKRFDFQVFKDKFRGIKTEKTFYTFFEEMITEKKSLGKVGTAAAYETAYHALKRYKSSDTRFSEVTYSFLKSVETYLYQTGCKAGGIGAYMRSVRAVYYEGVRRGLIEKDDNPFSTTMNKNGYSLAKLKSQKNPKALTNDEIEALKNFDHTNYPTLSRSWRLFMFSFRMFGMNFIDICNLKKENIVNGRIVYQRQKTGKSFNLKIRAEAQEIIDSFWDEELLYIFPIFRNDFHQTPEQRRNRHKKVLKKTNKDLKTIATLLNIQTPITFYVARHTSATTLKRNGISTEVISEALGHSDTQITQWYLKKFDNGILDSAMDKL